MNVKLNYHELETPHVAITNNYAAVSILIIDKKEIQSLKKKLSEQINLNNLNTDQKIYLTIDQSNNKVKKFIFQISNKEKILLSKYCSKL